MAKTFNTNLPIPNLIDSRGRLERFYANISMAMAESILMEMDDIQMRLAELENSDREDNELRAEPLEKKWNELRERRNSIMIASGVPVSINEDGIAFQCHRSKAAPWRISIKGPVESNDSTKNLTFAELAKMYDENNSEG